MRKLVMPMSFVLVTFFAIYLVVRNGTISYQKASGLLVFSGIVIFCFYSFIRLKELLPVEQYGYDAVFFILLILCFSWGRACACQKHGLQSRRRCRRPMQSRG